MTLNYVILLCNYDLWTITQSDIALVEMHIQQFSFILCIDLMTKRLKTSVNSKRQC